MPDPITSTATRVVGDAVSSATQTPDTGTIDAQVNQAMSALAARFPNLPVNDPRFQQVLRQALTDSFRQGNENILQNYLPQMLQELERQRIQVSGLNAQAFIDSAKEVVRSQLATQQGIYGHLGNTTTDLNVAGARPYWSSLGGLGAMATFFKACYDCFQQGSFAPLQALIDQTISVNRYGTGGQRIGTDVRNPNATYTDQSGNTAIGPTTGIRNAAEDPDAMRTNPGATVTGVRPRDTGVPVDTTRPRSESILGGVSLRATTNEAAAADPAAPSVARPLTGGLRLAPAGGAPNPAGAMGG